MTKPFHEIPILMRGDMVRATLDDSKSQTRRIIKPQPEYIGPGDSWLWRGGSALLKAGYGADYVHTEREAMKRVMLAVSKYQVGRRLWVKETHGFWCHSFESVGVEYAAGGEDQIVDFPNKVGMPSLEVQCRKNRGGGRRKRPSIFMPRWASRITLEILNVRVERIQEISEADAKAEGCCGVSSTQWGVPNFRYLWDSINAKRGHPFSSNPWVRVIQLKRI